MDNQENKEHNPNLGLEIESLILKITYQLGSNKIDFLLERGFLVTVLPNKDVVISKVDIEEGATKKEGDNPPQIFKFFMKNNTIEEKYSHVQNGEETLETREVYPSNDHLKILKDISDIMETYTTPVDAALNTTKNKVDYRLVA